MNLRPLFANGLLIVSLSSLNGCGDNTTNLGTLRTNCDDAGNRGDAIPNDSSSTDAAMSDTPSGRHHRLSITYTPDPRFYGVTMLNLRTLPPSAMLSVNEAFSQPPTTLPGGGYQAGRTVLEVNDDYILMNIDWTFNKSGPDAGVSSAFGSLFTVVTTAGPLSFILLGQITVIDELGRHWLGYPTILDGQQAAFMQFVPADRCNTGYTSRGDDTCVR